MKNTRRVMIVGVSLVVLAVVYMLFTGGGETQRGAGTEDVAVQQPDMTDASEKGGKVGPYNVGPVKQTEYTTRDEQKRIQRVFGFLELLHQTGDNWQLSKPYLKLYEEEAEITISADTGSVQVQTVGASPVPRDAKLTGNVRFHMVRKVGGAEEVSDVYMDDMVFVSDRSTFYTDGPVRLVSPQCQMQGRGLEVVYNSEMNKLLFFHLDQLEDMRFKMRTGNSFFKQGKPHETAAVTPPPAEGGAAAELASDYYECLLNDKVTIEYDRQVVLVDKTLVVRNILWATGTKPAARQSASIDAAGASSAPATPAVPAEPTVECRVVCDGGVVIKPVGGSVEQFRVRGARKKAIGYAIPEAELQKRNVFRTKALDYDVLSGDGKALGPVDVVFFADAVSATDVVAGKTRTSIASSKYATFSGKTNEVRFVGDVVAGAIEPAQGWTQKSTIYSDEAVAKIRSASDGRQDLSIVEDVNFIGKVVKLETVRKDGEKLLGGINLKCLNLHYTGKDRIITATGPGVIAVDNSHIENKAESSTQVNLSKRCYAAVDKFGELQWFVDSGKILAKGASEGLRIAYWPVLDGGGYGSRIVADTHDIAGTFVRLADGRSEIDTLNASGGVYVERGENQKIWGDTFLYTQNTGLLTVTGRPDKPCVYNGVRAQQFEMNVTDGSVKTKLSGGGVSR
jgi:hypothetical protein